MLKPAISSLVNLSFSMVTIQFKYSIAGNKQICLWYVVRCDNGKLLLYG